MFTKKRLFLIFLLAAIIVAAPIAAAFSRGESGASAQEMQVLTLWQIDSFEGGKGSRAQFLQDTADQLFKGERFYVTVNSISADAARKNIELGTCPDMISYGAGFYGIEELVNCSNFAYKVWCRGGYCLLTLDCQADFSDADAQNTVINGGKDNLVSICALFEGLNGAAVEKPTGAYVSLLNGKYKYLLGTQRDIFRLKTRGAQFITKPLTSFNDLYQNISILSGDKKYAACKRFVDYLTSENVNVKKLGLFSDGVSLYDDELTAMENLTFSASLKSFVSARYYGEVAAAANSGDLNLLKSLLK
ncbi:MAG: hypothetical protein ACI4L9_02080 [Candidatus Coproplasma sp.]